ncbi:MAG: large conductance mechanosensitive channel protein MscL [Ktedonobacteraceae bacterium]
MSSSEINEGDVTIIKSQVTTVSQTEVSGPKSELKHELKDFSKNLGTDFGKVSQGALKSLGGFRTFILRGNVVDLAIGIVIGAAFTSVVTAVVGDIITPLIPVPGGTLSSWKVPVLYSQIDSITKQHAIVNFGAFINAIISFLIVAAVIYFFVVLPVNKLTKLYHPKEAEAHATRNCLYCMQPVHLDATRCPFCTSHLTAEEGKREAEEPVLMLPETLEKLAEQLAEKIARKTAQLEKVGAVAKE